MFGQALDRARLTTESFLGMLMCPLASNSSRIEYPNNNSTHTIHCISSLHTRSYCRFYLFHRMFGRARTNLGSERCRNGLHLSWFILEVYVHAADSLRFPPLLRRPQNRWSHVLLDEHIQRNHELGINRCCKVPAYPSVYSITRPRFNTSHTPQSCSSASTN